MTEQWRPFFDGDYEVSDHGNVRRAKPGRRTYVGRPIELTLMKIGYYKISPVRKGKNVYLYVHHLVAEAFIGPRPEDTEINHKDGDKKNNHVSNLEYVTHHENMSHASSHGLLPAGNECGKSHLTDDDVRAMRLAWDGGSSGKELSKRFGVSAPTISEIVNRKKWKHVQ